MTEATNAMQQEPTEDVDLKSKRDAIKISIEMAKKMTCANGDLGKAPVVQVLEDELAKLQPPPKAPSLHNQLRNAQVLVATKQEERVMFIATKEKTQKEIEEQHQMVAKTDRGIATVDGQIDDLGDQVQALLHEAGRKPETPQLQPEEELSDAWAAKIISHLGLTIPEEELKAKMKR